MPNQTRHRLLTPTQCQQLLALPSSPKEVARFFTLTDPDLEVIRKHRSDANRIGFCVQLCLLRHFGRAWTRENPLPEAALNCIAEQISVAPARFEEYAKRDATRREHLAELLEAFGWRTMSRAGYRDLSKWLLELARGIDHGVPLMIELLEGELPRSLRRLCAVQGGTAGSRDGIVPTQSLESHEVGVRCVQYGVMVDRQGRHLGVAHEITRRAEDLQDFERVPNVVGARVEHLHRRLFEP
ncbi:MAG: DUF4158 domain-containing protein [Verrucomicrobiales bacterium]|nr:DUF4158 domain-containing protein [Verrucomicrobiales bacterium]